MQRQFCSEVLLLSVTPTCCCSPVCNLCCIFWSASCCFPNNMRCGGCLIGSHNIVLHQVCGVKMQSGTVLNGLGSTRTLATCTRCLSTMFFVGLNTSPLRDQEVYAHWPVVKCQWLDAEKQAGNWVDGILMLQWKHIVTSPAVQNSTDVQSMHPMRMLIS